MPGFSRYDKVSKDPSAEVTMPPTGPASLHFTVGESVKRAHTAPEKIIGLFIYDDGATLLTLRAEDGSVSHILPVALNH